MILNEYRDISNTLKCAFENIVILTGDRSLGVETHCDGLLLS